MLRLEIRCHTHRVLTARSRHLTLDQTEAGYNDLSTRTYAYDAHSNVISDLQSGGVGPWLSAKRLHEYDTLDQLTQSAYADRQNWDLLPKGDNYVTSTYVYHQLGNRKTHNYRDAVDDLTYEHDLANRMTQITDEGGPTDYTQEYDDAGNLTVTYAANLGNTYKYEYDHNNQDDPFDSVIGRTGDPLTAYRSPARRSFTLSTRQTSDTHRWSAWPPQWHVRWCPWPCRSCPCRWWRTPERRRLHAPTVSIASNSNNTIRRTFMVSPPARDSPGSADMYIR
ncbi:MAG: hypothetical protein IID40_00930 [Planctomycetes bacterium]|nr:hypothetical protein [Planctomycetota bacterium]